MHAHCMSPGHVSANPRSLYTLYMLCTLDMLFCLNPIIEEEVDGETAILLARAGNSDHLQRCGLKKLKSELKFRSLFKFASSSSSNNTITDASITYATVTNTDASSTVADRKLTGKEIKSLTPEEKRTYLIRCLYNYACHYHITFFLRRNRVNDAAKSMWPGNKIPLFKGKGEEARRNREVLSNLVAKLVPGCQFSSTSLPVCHFGSKGIQQHLLDTLNERRRRVHFGHDYETVILIITTYSK